MEQGKVKRPHRRTLVPKEARHKVDLDAQTAALLGLKHADVARITTVFLHEAAKALAEGKAVRLDRFGVLHIMNRRGVAPRPACKGIPAAVETNRQYVQFRKAVPLTRLLRAKRASKIKGEKKMDKYGVDESVGEDLEKKAAEGCPVFGKKPVRQGKVLLCPTHGSEPWEAK